MENGVWVKQGANWFLSIGGRKGHGVTLREDAFFSFVCSFGPDSDRSYSGCFYGLDVHSLEEAKQVISRNASKINRGDMFTNDLPRDETNRYTGDGAGTVARDYLKRGL